MSVIYNGEVDSRTFKQVFASAFEKMAAEDPGFIYLDADLMSSLGTTKFAADHPDKAINCGIAEANMVGIACGLSAVGFKPYVHSFAPFASRRCYDQAFISGAYAHKAITVIGSDPGVCAGFNGGTHMPFEDLALYRAVPEATVLDVSDIPMLANLLPKLKDLPGVKYIRSARKNPVKIYSDDTDFEIGKGAVLRDGRDAVIIACDIMTAKALAAAETLAAEGIDAAVIDMYSLKPIDAELILEYAEKTGAVVTAENHNKYGALYSAVSEVLAAGRPTPLEYVAVEDCFGAVGPQSYLEERFGLTSAHIADRVRAVIARK